MLKNFLFSKNIYPVFKKEIKRVTEEDQIIILWENEDNFITIIAVLKNEFLIFSKERHGAFIIKKFSLPESLKIIDIPLNDFKKYVFKMKEHGIILSSQHIVEFLNNNLRGSITYYGFKRQEVAELFNRIVIENKEIFKSNPPSTVMESSTNKWID